MDESCEVPFDPRMLLCMEKILVVAAVVVVLVVLVGQHGSTISESWFSCCLWLYNVVYSVVVLRLS